MGLLRRLYVGDKPPPTEPLKPTGPRPLTIDDIEEWQEAASHHVGQATWKEMDFVLGRLKKSDPVKVWSIRRDIRWLARQAAAMKIFWTDFYE